jgi:hypothetical protein
MAGAPSSGRARLRLPWVDAAVREPAAIGEAEIVSDIYTQFTVHSQEIILGMAVPSCRQE